MPLPSPLQHHSSRYRLKQIGAAIVATIIIIGNGAATALTLPRVAPLPHDDLTSVSLKLSSPAPTMTGVPVPNMAMNSAPTHSTLTIPSPSLISSTQVGLTIPILVYHEPPADLAAQFEYLKTHNYTTVSLAQIAAAMNGGTPLPLKPVALTFDDGYETQMSAVTLLEQYQYKAAFYIIDGGVASRWCIGAGRRYNDPLQPPSGCGDQYLTWDQVRALDKNPLFTIGSHTIDHPDLATESVADQTFEIVTGKTELEAQLGHPVYDFAYPYGDYNQTTINIVKNAGFRTAVTTNAATYQPAGSLLTLNRIRDTEILP